MPLRFVIDEDSLDRRLWRAIRQHNARQTEWAIDAVRVGEPGGPHKATLDPELILWSIAHNRIIVSQDRSTLIGHFRMAVDGGQLPPGLLLLDAEASLPEIIDSLSLIAHAGLFEEFACQYWFIPFR